MLFRTQYQKTRIVDSGREDMRVGGPCSIADQTLLYVAGSNSASRAHNYAKHFAVIVDSAKTTRRTSEYVFSESRKEMCVHRLKTVLSKGNYIFHPTFNFMKNDSSFMKPLANFQFLYGTFIVQSEITRRIRKAQLPRNN